MFKLIRKKSLLTRLLSLFILLQPGLCLAKSVHDVKAAYIYNFIKFISWPKSENKQDLKLCILGEDLSNDKLNLLDNRPIRERMLHVRKITQVLPTSQCDVVFIGSSEEKFLNDIFNTLKDLPVLTLSSIPDFANQGGTIGFITLGNVIRFNINLKQANETQLTISSKLLELANLVLK